MTRQITRGLLALLAILTVAAAAPAAENNQSRRLFHRYTVEAPRWQGPIQGPWEATGGVTVRGPGVTMTCERLKVWFASDTWVAERITATGNIVLRGRYTATDRTEWDVVAHADTATYDNAAGRGTLEGSVTMEATNLTTDALLSVSADRLIYDGDSGEIRAERVENPVIVEWTEPVADDESAAEAAQQQAAQQQAAPQQAPPQQEAEGESRP